MQNTVHNQPEQIIQNKLSAVQRRMQIDSIFQNLATFNFWGLFIAGILLGANRLFPLPIPVGLALCLPIAVASVAAVGATLLQKIDLLAVARLVDQRLNLKARLATALETMGRKDSSDFAVLQIRDAAQVSQGVLPTAAVSYAVPPSFKWLSIPMLLIIISFFIPRMYEISPPLTVSEHAAIHDAAAKLEGAVTDLNDTELSKQVEQTVKALRNERSGVADAQKALSKLRADVEARKSQLAENDIHQGENSNMLSGANAEKIASELQQLADQMNELTETQRTELDALLKQLAARLGGNSAAKHLVDRLNEIETKEISSEMLARIARALLEIDRQAKDIARMETILEEIKASRKNIGLAGIEMARKTGGVAGGDGGPGEESGTGEARGTQVGAISSGEQSTEALRLGGVTSDSEEFATVSTQEAPSDEYEPPYMPYRKVYLNAKQTYAEAVEREGIPVRYRQRVKDYLDAIVNTTE